MYCWNCGHKIDDNATVCIECGSNQQITKRGKRSVLLKPLPLTEKQKEEKAFNRRKKRLLVAGILNIILPGLGHLSLFHILRWFFQLTFTVFFFAGYIWSINDGVNMIRASKRMKFK